ncbi:MAG: excinuclease ABC subunit UvrC [Chloroflexota bacterium]|nr:excinuclease ABC subunit UvrC [Chloroflexota bacterium]
MDSSISDTASTYSEPLRQRLGTIPTGPGVYLFKDKAGNILYVGKAANLYNRVHSYFGAAQGLSYKTQRLVARIEDFELFVTSSDQEALLLECNLIKKHCPHYNVRLKDDKSYPYLKVSLSEDWPRVYVTRRLEKDGARYFGPFASASSVRQTLQLIRTLFPIRSCRKNITGRDTRPCLEYHLHRCLGPCIGQTTREEYREIIRQLILFLDGKQEVVLRQLRNKMQAAAQNLEYEKAGLVRDQIRAVEKVMERQTISAPQGEMDAIAFAQTRDRAYVQVFFIRSGKLIGREHFILEGTDDETPSQIMGSFVSQFYNYAPDIPPLVLIEYDVEDLETLERYLRERRGSKVELRVPQRGLKKDLLTMVEDNARQGLEQLRFRLITEPEAISEALGGLAKELQLPADPRRVECYDISNIQGTSAVGSMVVFDEGIPRKSHYRRFKIHTVEGPDDYSMLREVLRRRFRKNPEGTWAILPNLVLIDGGKGQLNAAMEVMSELEVDSVPVASIAKEREEIFIPGRSDPVLLPANSAALYLLQRIRDEAHRFAITYHQRLRQRDAFTSPLDRVPGIGSKRKRALMKEFGSIRAIKQATLEDLARVKGITPYLARNIKEFL